MSRPRFDLVNTEGRPGVGWRCLAGCTRKGQAPTMLAAVNAASDHLAAAHQAPGITDELFAAPPD